MPNTYTRCELLTKDGGEVASVSSVTKFVRQEICLESARPGRKRKEKQESEEGCKGLSGKESGTKGKGEIFRIGEDF